MKITKIDFALTNHFSKRDLAYVAPKENLRDFYKYDVTLGTFRQVIEDKKNEGTNRQLLCNILQQQYDKIGRHPAVEKNIALLQKDNCFTVTTAHQPCLFFGPLYYVYKIISTINLSRQLCKAFPEFEFVPVFVSGAEDHDFDEINHAYLFNKKIVWSNNDGGPVGKISTKSLKPVLEELKVLLGNSLNAEKIWTIINNAYTKFDNYGYATLKLVHEIFKTDGLVVLDMNQAELKHAFATVMENELFNQNSFQLVSDQIAELQERGYKAQATPREINLFYIKNNNRNRIVQQEDGFLVHGTDLSFSKEAMQKEIRENPERFSPNVILRPLYQEIILPNLAYVGGGGELAYWLERKRQFEFYNINFPMLIRRNSVLIVDKNADKKLEKLGLQDDVALFSDTERLVNAFVREHSNSKINLEQEKAALNKLFGQIEKQASAIDVTLIKTVNAELARQLKGIDQLESRLLKAEKQKHESDTIQIRNLKSRLFPENKLQERHDNFLPFYLKHGDAFFQQLLEVLNPLEKGLVVIRQLH